MVNVKYANAMREVLEYLKGINDEDVAKISAKFMDFLNENASKEFVCEFDYNKPLAELKISQEAKAIIGVIYYNFWCETEQQRRDFLALLDDNEKVYQEELHEKYNAESIFDVPPKIDSDKETLENTSGKDLVTKNNIRWYKRLFRCFRQLFKK